MIAPRSAFRRPRRAFLGIAKFPPFIIIVSMAAATTAMTIQAAAAAPALSRTQASALARFLPDRSAAGEWRKKGDPDYYGPDDLYLYIDGGAEIYREYGILKVAAQEYKNPADKNISLEVFEMTDGGAGYGIFRFKTSLEGRTVPLGEEGRLEGYYLNFRKGRFLVTLTGQDDSEETVKGLLSVGGGVDRLLPVPEKNSLPGLLSQLPQKELIEPSLKYFRGHLGLFNLRPFSTRDVFRFKEGCRGSYPGGVEVYLLAYDTPAACLERSAAAVRALGEESRFRMVDGRDGAFLLEDSKKISLFIQPRGNLLFIISGADPDRARRMVEAAPHR